MGAIMYRDKVYGAGGGGGGSTVTITPTLSTGTKIADFEIDGTAGELYAPQGGGGGINYSTQEQVIGTWIDGKPIYQKVIDNLTVSFSSSGSVGRYASIDLSNYLSNIDKLWVDFSASYYLLNSTNQRSFLYAAFSNGATLDLFVETNRSNVPVVLALRYTKTTDTAS